MIWTPHPPADRDGVADGVRYAITDAMKERGLRSSWKVPSSWSRLGASHNRVLFGGREAPVDRQYVGIDFHRRRSVIVRKNAAGEKLGSVRVANDPLALATG